MIANLLTIAGSDSGGGAGIQADLKTFSALGTYGLSVITAVTAQNTCGVHGVMAITAEMVRAQCDAVFADIRIDAVKIGMLATADIIDAVATALTHWQPASIVLDPVMVAKGGHALLAETAATAVRTRLLPLAHLITPNLAEAAVLLGERVATTETGMVEQGQRLCALGAQAVLMKGGHLAGPHSPDWLITATDIQRFDAPRLPTRHTHGTGCTLSSAIAALRGRGLDWPLAIHGAKHWLNGALQQAERLTVGQGIGPVHHFHALWPGVVPPS